ncbi:MAG: glycosyltransferase family 9 protein [Gammaproteobacteria bacterium]|nr:glycosyltransferase family 9 protein [Gammaproteobacteria bacterium]
MKILVIRLKQIGDALLSLPVCSSLKKTFPDAQVDYLVYAHIAPLLEGHPDIDNILTISEGERANVLQYARKILELRRRRYDIAFDLITVPASALICFLSGAEKRIGFGHRRTRSFLYRTKVPHPTSGNTVNAKLAILAGLPGEIQYQRDFKLYLEAREILRMRETLVQHGVQMDKLVLFFPATSRRDYKFWPADYFARVIEYCRERYDAQVILNWIPGAEKVFVDELTRRLSNTKGVFADIPCGLREMAALIANCDLVVGNDGGPIHIAVGVGTPSLAVFSPLNSKHAWLPENNDRHRGIDINDTLGIDESERNARTQEFKQDLERYYRAITPELVIAELDRMVERYCAGAPAALAVSASAEP